MIKNILKQMWEHKLGTFVLLAGCFMMVVGELIIGCVLLSISLPLFDNDDKN
jgi:Flp pilus assembly protein TadB